MSAEMVVSITDCALAAYSGSLAWNLLSRQTEMRRTRYWFAIVLGSIALSSLLGGISHGFVSEEARRLGALLWRAALVAIGPGAVGLWMLASMLLFRPTRVERARVLGLIALAIYTGVVLFEYQDFMIALAMYLPAVIMLLVGFAVHLRGNSFSTSGLIAMVLMLTAGLLQYLRVSLHPVYFNHDAVYRLVQAIAVFFLYRTAIRWLEPSGSKVPVLKSQPLIAKIG
jgi:MFS family permease